MRYFGSAFREKTTKQQEITVLTKSNPSNSLFSPGLNNLLTSSMDSSVDSDSGSSSMSSGINRTTLLTGLPNSMDSFSSPFAALGGGLSMGKDYFEIL